MLSSATCQSLVGHAWQGSQHDLPGRIGEFVERSEGAFGDSASKLARQHTLIGFYLPWRTFTQQEKALQAMEGRGIGMLKMYLGLPASRLGASHPLKFCPECFTRDRDSHGVAYWHLAHQYPGVWICTEHGCVLLESNIKTTGVGRFLWHLPKLKSTQPLFGGSKPSPTSLAVITALSRLVCRASTLPPSTCIDYERLLHVYRRELRSQGLISDSGRLVLSKICEKYQATTVHFYFVPELSSLHQESVALQTQLRRQLNGPRPGTHPLRHLVFILVFFGDWSSFWDVYQSREGVQMMHDTPADLPAQSLTPTRRNTLKREKFLRLMTNDGYSASRAANEVGVDRHTGVVWATAQGLPTHSHFNYPPGTRMNLLKALKRGADIAQLAKKHAVSVQSVTQIGRAHV